MSSDVMGATGGIVERARPDRAVDRAGPPGLGSGVSDRSYRILAGTNEAIIRASDPREMYAEVCEVLVRSGSYAAAWVAQLEEDATLRVVATAGDVEPIGTNPSLTDPSLTDPSLTDPPLRAPLHVAGQVVGELSLVGGRSQALDDGVDDLLRRVAANVSFALGTFAAAERMRELADHRGRLVSRVVSAEQRERVRIANDIHDESVPLLASLELRLGLLGESRASADPAVRAALTDMQTTLTRAVSGLRDLLFELDDEGADDLPEAVREAADQILSPCGVCWELTVEGEVALPQIERLQVLRILKEALVNVRKHAHACSVGIILLGRPDGVEVEVADDGVGLSGGPQRRPGHRGLASMRHRAEVSGGWLRLEPGPEGGTTVRFAVPVTTAQLEEA